MANTRPGSKFASSVQSDLGLHCPQKKKKKHSVQQQKIYLNTKCKKYFGQITKAYKGTRGTVLGSYRVFLAG